MFKVVVKRQDTVTHEGQFPTLSEAQDWVAMHEAKGEKCAWGLPGEFTVEILDLTLEFEEALRQDEARKTAKSEALARFKTIDTANSIPELRALVKDLAQVLGVL